MKSIFGRNAVVTEIFPGCPAEAVGIRTGDRVLKANDHEFTWRDNQSDYWQIMDGRAGTVVNITVSRRGKLITFPLTRMNIEDIPDNHLRRTFEHMVRRLGAPCE